MTKVAGCPVEDCRLDIDVVLKSSDGELFGAHQRNLETFTEGFPIAASTVATEPVSLEETAEVLRLVLKFTHNIRSPNLDNTTDFTLLASLAEAVEKYMMYSPMEICRIQMMNAINIHPNEVFFYSIKHNYPKLGDKAAKLTLNNPAWDFVDLIRKAGFHDGIVVRWLRYRDCRMEVLLQWSKSTLPDWMGADCKVVLYQFKDEVFREVSGDLTALDRFSGVVNRLKLIHCKTCKPYGNKWESCASAMIEELPKYSEV